jgi:hypothetical protein
MLLHVGFEVFTAVNMHVTVFSDVELHISLSTFRMDNLYLQGNGHCINTPQMEASRSSENLCRNIRFEVLTIVNL